MAVGRIAHDQARSVGESLLLEVSGLHGDHALQARGRNVVAWLLRNASVLFDADHGCQIQIASAALASPLLFALPEFGIEVSPALQAKAGVPAPAPVAVRT